MSPTVVLLFGLLSTLPVLITGVTKCVVCQTSMRGSFTGMLPTSFDPYSNHADCKSDDLSVLTKYMQICTFFSTQGSYGAAVGRYNDSDFVCHVNTIFDDNGKTQDVDRSCYFKRDAKNMQDNGKLTLVGGAGCYSPTTILSAVTCVCSDDSCNTFKFDTKSSDGKYTVPTTKPPASPATVLGGGAGGTPGGDGAVTGVSLPNGGGIAGGSKVGDSNSATTALSRLSCSCFALSILVYSLISLAYPY